jgi:dTDP-4-dehydrorhamnose 3,5-epimerase
MNILSTPLKGAYIIEPKLNTDHRGFFSRVYSTWEFEAAGIRMPTIETNFSHNVLKGTLRGMHWQKGETAQDKLVRCVRGAIYDVIVDIRRDSDTYGQWFGIELSQENFKALLVPKGFAHGFVTLCDNVDVIYQVSHQHAPGNEGGFRFDDPYFKIHWPVEITVISEKDKSWPDFSP